ncbi:MAG: helix-turn-helix domain-containing protein [Anaerolineae bacterium]|nr:helix-turn-helix domain-containing protein [Anaerolineae bacterium]
MDLEDLRKLIHGGESETVEFKISFDRETVETSGAFANTKGGTTVIGVSDKGEIKGIEIGMQTLKDWSNQISQSTEPRVVPEMESFEEDGKNVVLIRIKEFPLKPVSVKGRYFRRVGNSNRIMPMQEISQMHFNSADMSWDKLPAAGASIDDLDLDGVKRYIDKANETRRRKIGNDENPLQVLEKLELIKDGVPTWAAILLFRKQPRRLLSQAAIHCGRFKEETVVVDDRMIEGTIIEQIDETMDFIRKNINVKFVMTGEPAREQIWDYPLAALREAVINAVCHRDYILSSNVEVRIYDDQLIVWSPGGLPVGITIADLYKPHASALRNKGIAGVFYDLELIEQWGSGIDKMRNACVGAGIPEPLFEEYQGFRVIFRKDSYTEDYLHNLGLNERQIKAVLHMKKKRTITNEAYQKLNEVKRRLATYELEELIEKGVAIRVGKVGKGTHYRLNKG